MFYKPVNDNPNSQERQQSLQTPEGSDFKPSRRGYKVEPITLEDRLNQPGTSREEAEGMIDAGVNASKSRRSDKINFSVSGAEAYNIAGEVGEAVAWAITNGKFLTESDWLPKMNRGGREHSVWFDDQLNRIFKATKPGAFGMQASINNGEGIVFTASTPAAYLWRIHEANELFSDDIRREGVIMTDLGLCVVTSQPFIPHYPSDEVSIESYMINAGFVTTRFDGAFWHPVRQVLAFDAHPWNVVMQRQTNKIAAIDVPIQKVSPGLARHLGIGLEPVDIC